MDFSLDSVRIAQYGTRFSRMFWEIAAWTQSATDDPEFVSQHGYGVRETRESTLKPNIQICNVLL